jgi:nucleolar MIF4G domain-containing protein 1
MVTDIKKAVFQAIVGSEDYLEAFEKLNSLNLKKTQQREIVRVLLHCCLNEKTYNKYYTLLAQRFIQFDP